MKAIELKELPRQQGLVLFQESNSDLQRQPLVIKDVFKVTWQTDIFFPPELVNKLHIMP